MRSSMQPLVWCAGGDAGRWSVCAALALSPPAAGLGSIETSLEDRCLRALAQPAARAASTYEHARPSWIRSGCSVDLVAFAEITDHARAVAGQHDSRASGEYIDTVEERAVDLAVEMSRVFGRSAI